MKRNDYSIYNKVQKVKASKRNWNWIVLVENGDYYEAYEEDADNVAGICGVGQFNRSNCLLNIAGFGKEYLKTNLAKMIKAGWRVSILGESYINN